MRTDSSEHHSGHSADSLCASRRDFLKTISVVSAAVALGSHNCRLQAQSDGGILPQIKLGKYNISRLICGGNTFNAGSHLSVFFNNELRAYYTEEQKLKTLRRCQEVGINTFQSSGNDIYLYKKFTEQGGRMNYFTLGTANDDIKKFAENGCIGVAHHGEVTDRLFKSRQLDEILEFIKKVRDSGLLVGVSTHIPEVVEEVESRGWDIDFYMTCVYQRHRSEAELKKLLGFVPLPVGEVYLKEDPPRMFRVVQQTKRTCFAFKILAAGRLCERKEWVEDAFRRTFESIKPHDCVIVGLFDKYSDQPAEDAEYTRKYSSLSTLKKS